MSHATRLLDLPEFEIHLVVHVADETHVVIARPRGRQACTRCGLIDDHTVHDRVVHRIRDLPSAGRPVVLVWHERVLTSAGGCVTFRERSREIAPRACWTARARAEAVRQVAADNRSVAAVARTFGVAWDTVMRTVHDQADRVLASRTGARVVTLGLDETVMNPTRSRSRRRYITALVDLDAHQVIDVIEGRSAADVITWLGRQEPVWRDQVATVALELRRLPHRRDASAGRTGQRPTGRGLLPRGEAGQRRDR